MRACTPRAILNVVLHELLPKRYHLVLLPAEPRCCWVDPAPDAQRAQHQCCTRATVCLPGSCGALPPGQHRVLKAVHASVLAFAVPYECCHVGPALDARHAMESVTLVLRSYACVWHVSVEALFPRPSSTESRHGLCCTVWLLPRRPRAGCTACKESG